MTGKKLRTRLWASIALTGLLGLACMDMDSAGFNPSSEEARSYYSDGGYSSDAGSMAGDEQLASEQGEADAGTPDTGDWAWFQLSPDDSTSMATAQLLKTGLDGYHSFPLQSHEVLNYYDPPAALREESALAQRWTTQEGVVIGIDAVRHSGFEGDEAVEAIPDELELLVHVFAPQVPELDRKRWNLHLCVDVSGSMSGDKIGFARQALLKLADAMQEGDRVSLTTFSSAGRQVFASQEFSANEAAIRAAILALGPEGSTNMIAGLRIAYAEALAAYDPATVNRVLLFSDGQANVGDTDIESFAALTRINNQEGIYLSGVGVGYDYAAGRMDALTDAGKGAHVFLPDAAEVEVIFGGMVRKLVEVAADEVAIELQLPGSFALEAFSGEEVSTNPDARVPNIVLAAGDDMTVLARFSSDDPEAFDQDLILTLRYRPLATAEQVVFEQRLSIADLLGDGHALLQRTRLVDRYARWACGENSEEDLDSLRASIASAASDDPGLAEIGSLIDWLR